MAFSIMLDDRAIEPGTMVRRRIAALLVAGLCLGVLLVAGSLRPAAGGLGTHTQMGLPPCSVKVMHDMPCPTCGMTTAFALAAHGRLIEAFVVQPFGAILALGLAMAVVVGGYVAVTGAAVGRWLRPLRSSSTLWVVLGMLVAAWGYKIAAYKGAFG
jgi:di/tricarboxylate transporter